ncbi:MAG: hypothetical protein QW835_05040 [Candidatus Hadarchaeum sp.]
MGGPLAPPHEPLCGVAEVIPDAAGELHVAADLFDVAEELGEAALPSAPDFKALLYPVPPLPGPRADLDAVGQVVDLSAKVAVVPPCRCREVDGAAEGRVSIVLAIREKGKHRAKDQAAAHADPLPGAPVADDPMVAQ